MGGITVSKGGAAVSVGVHIEIDGSLLGAVFQHKVRHGGHGVQVGAAGQVKAFTAEQGGLKGCAGNPQRVAAVQHKKERHPPCPGGGHSAAPQGAERCGQGEQAKQIDGRQDEALMIPQGLGAGKERHGQHAGGCDNQRRHPQAAHGAGRRQPGGAENEPHRPLGAELAQAVVPESAAVIGAVNIGIVGGQDGAEGGQQHHHNADHAGHAELEQVAQHRGEPPPPGRARQHRSHIDQIERQDPEHIPPAGQDQRKGGGKQAGQPGKGQCLEPLVRAEQQNDCHKHKAKGIRHSVGGRPKEHGPQHHGRHAQGVIQAGTAAREPFCQLFGRHEQRKPHRHKAGQGIADHKRIDGTAGEEVGHADEEVHEHLVIRREQIFGQNMNPVKPALPKTAEQKRLLGKIVDGIVVIDRVAVEDQRGNDRHPHCGPHGPADQKRRVVPQALPREGGAPCELQQQTQPAHTDGPQQHHQQHTDVGSDGAARKNAHKQQHPIHQPARTGGQGLPSDFRELWHSRPP